MSTHITRHLKRFLIAALFEAILALFLISAARLLYVRRAVENARALAGESKYEQVIDDLRLAHVWAPAYPAFSETTRALLDQAHARLGRSPDLPANEPRSFTANIRPIEKSLIIPDMAVNWLYGMITKNTAEPPSHTAQPSEPAFSPDPAEQASRPTIPVTDPPYRGVSADSFSGTPPPASYDVPPAPAGSAQPASDSTPEPASVVISKPRDPNAMWGTTIRAETDIFGQDGKKMRSVPGGSLVNVHSTKQTQKGEIVLCTIRSSAGKFTNVFIRRKDLELYEGQAIADSTKEQRELVSKRGRILAQIEARSIALETEAKGKNPFQEQYRSVLLEYKRISDQAEALNKEWTTSTGSRRSDLGNQLRLLKNEQANLMPRYQDSKQKKEDWEKKNSGVRPNPENDPQIQQLKDQLRAIDAQLHNS